MVDVGLEKPRQVRRVVLAVGIHGDGMGETLLQRASESCQQGASLAAVVGMGLYRDAGDGAQRGRGAVGAAVVDHDDVAAELLRLGHHTLDAPHVVVGGNDHADAPLAEQLAQLLLAIVTLLSHN